MGDRKRSEIRSAGHEYTRSMGEAGPYLVIGIQIAGGMLLFIFGGYFADQWLDTRPWLMILGAVLGMIAMVTTVVRAAQDLDKRARKKREHEESR